MRFRAVLGLEYVKKQNPRSAATWVLKRITRVADERLAADAGPAAQAAPSD